jgi:hypothetical protein
MQPEPFRALFRFAAAPRVELVLRAPGGAPWVLTMSAGVERFIGLYPRLGGIAAEGPILDYRATA